MASSSVVGYKGSEELGVLELKLKEATANITRLREEAEYFKVIEARGREKAERAQLAATKAASCARNALRILKNVLMGLAARQGYDFTQAEKTVEGILHQNVVAVIGEPGRSFKDKWKGLAELQTLYDALLAKLSWNAGRKAGLSVDIMPGNSGTKLKDIDRSADWSGVDGLRGWGVERLSRSTMEIPTSPSKSGRALGSHMELSASPLRGGWMEGELAESAEAFVAAAGRASPEEARSLNADLLRDLGEKLTWLKGQAQGNVFSEEGETLVTRADVQNTMRELLEAQKKGIMETLRRQLKGREGLNCEDIVTLMREAEGHSSPSGGAEIEGLVFVVEEARKKIADFNSEKKKAEKIPPPEDWRSKRPVMRSERGVEGFRSWGVEGLNGDEVKRWEIGPSDSEHHSIIRDVFRRAKLRKETKDRDSVLNSASASIANDSSRLLGLEENEVGDSFLCSEDERRVKVTEHSRISKSPSGSMLVQRKAAHWQKVPPVKAADFLKKSVTPNKRY